jgi:hypothetical protein
MNIRTFWKSRAGTNLNRFTKSGETASEVILTNAPTAVTDPGTAFTADRMNSIENRISDNQLDIQAVKAGGFWNESLVQSGFSTLRDMGFDYQGNSYLCSRLGAKIYKQEYGEGLFVDQGYSALAYHGICFTENGDAYATTLTGNVYRKLSSELDFTLFTTVSGASQLWPIINCDGTIYVADVNSGGSIYKLVSGSFVAVSGWPTGAFAQIRETPNGYVIGLDSSNDLIRLNIDGTYSTIYTGTVVSFAISQSGNIYIIEGGYVKKSIDGGNTFSNVIATSATAVDIGRDGKIYLHGASTISRLSYNTTENAVLLTDNQTVDGVKTFTSIPVLPSTNPTTSNEAARKGYVDDHDGFGVSYFESTVLTAANTPLAVKGTYGINETNLSYLNVYGYTNAACTLRITNTSGSNRVYHYLLIAGTTPSTATATISGGATVDISLAANTSIALKVVMFNGFSAQFRRGSGDATLRFYCEGRV